MVYIHVDNHYRITTASEKGQAQNTENNFIYPLSRPVNSVELMILKHARMPIMPTVITGWNDTIQFLEGANLRTAVVAQGYYTQDELIAALNVVMTAAATGTFTSTYNANTNKFTFISSANFQFISILTATNPAIQERMDKMIGYNNIPSAAATSLALTHDVDLVSVKYFTLIIELNGFKNAECVARNVAFSFVVPNNTTALQGNVIYKERDFEQVNHINHVNVNVVRVKTYLEDTVGEATNYLAGFVFELFLELVQGKNYAYVGSSKR
jgi:hypothetical protein